MFQRLAVPSRHRRESCSSDEVVGAFFVELELFRTTSGPSMACGRVDGVEVAARACGAHLRRDDGDHERAVRAPRATTVSTTQGQSEVGRPLLQQRPRRPVAVQGDDQVPAVGHLEGHPHLRDLSREPITGLSGRREDVQDEVRQPRHEPALC